MSSQLDDRVRSVFWSLTKVLVGASILELVLKLFWRMGMYLPLKGVLATVYFTLSQLQGVLFNFASLLTFAILGLAVYAGFRDKLWEGRLKHVVLASVSVVLLLSAVALVVRPDNALGLAYLLASSLAIASLAAHEMIESRRFSAGLAIGLVALAFLSYRYYVGATVVNNMTGSASEPFLAIEALALGELVFAVAPLAFFVAYAGVRAPRELLAHRLPLIVATGAALVFAVVNAVSSAMTSVYAIWTLGFSLRHPIIVYLLSAWFMFFTLTACLKNRETRYVAFGLLLVFASGLTHKVTYQHLLGIVGLVVLAAGRRMAAPADR